jgi:hypothetical protein
VSSQDGLGSLVHPPQNQRTQHGKNASGGGDEQNDPQPLVALVLLVDPRVDGLHHPKVDSAANPREAQLQPENHVQLFALEPQDRVIVLRHRERLGAYAETTRIRTFRFGGLGFLPENKSAHDRYPEGVEEDAAGENDLP